MFPDPSQQCFVFHLACRSSETHFCDLLVGIFQTNPVDFQECQHHIHADLLVFIEE